MELNLSSDQEMLRSTTRRFLEREASSAQIRKLAETANGFDRTWWLTAAELGWTSLLVPEALNGGSVSGSPLQDAAILVEEVGQFAAPGPINVTNAVIAGLTQVGDTGHGAAIARIMAGSSVATWAAYEPSRGWEPHNPQMKALTVEGGYRLSGFKDRVEAGDQADFYLLGARVSGEVRQFLIGADTPGISAERVWSLDFTRHYATVRFEDVFVPQDALVGEAADVPAMIERQCQTMFVLQSAETSGATERVLAMTLEWAMDRIAFDRPVAAYQAIKHRFANMKTWLEAMHAITAGAVRAVQDADQEAPLLSRAAKIFTSVKSGEIIQDCIQIHGGIGVTWEHDLHLFLRRATVNRILYGTPEEHRHTLAAMLDDERNRT